MAGRRTELIAVEGDITQLDVDVIVNAANSALAGGGGVDGAIHRAAGPELLAACRGIGGCPTGEACITPGFALDARYVVHTVGPVWQGGAVGEADLLARCYQRSLELAVAHDAPRIAFPAISTGVYGYPLADAASIAVGEVIGFLDQRQTKMEQVIFSCFGSEAYEVYSRTLKALE